MTEPGDDRALRPFSFEAVNLPEHADNPIHTDEGARAAGFPAALVAGVTTYAAMTSIPQRAWGRDWLRHGGVAVRFRHPILEGQRVDCVVGREHPGSVQATVDGTVCVEAHVVERVDDPIARRQGERLDPIEFTADASWADYGARSGDDSQVVERRGLVHPSAWPRIANQFCHEQLVSGAWIHTSSRIAHLGLARVGSRIEASADVIERIDSRAGRRAILDVWVFADAEPVAAIEHEAIIEVA